MMTNFDIAHQRLHNQRLLGNPFEQPADVVGWLGAVQAQDYAGAKWAVGQRTHGMTDATLDQAFAAGTILRTHVLRPTWHFVTPADIRWMLALTAPRVHALNAAYYRKAGLDEAVFARSNAALIRALQGGQQLTRSELATFFQQAGIATDEELRFTYLMMQAELDGIVCSGGRRGKQFTYALLDERAPNAKRLPRDEALAELVKRYFTSHGPATLKDFVWWSGLTLADAKAGVEMVKPELTSEVVGDQTLWFAPALPPAQASTLQAYLLPNYDEYISYADRSAVFDPCYANKFNPEENNVFSHLIVIDGQILGTWRRSFKKGAVVIERNSFRPLTPAEDEAVVTATQRFAEFLDLPLVLSS